MNQTVCRVGIVGAGRIGRLHAENIKYHLPQYDLQAIADPNLDQGWAEKLAIPHATNKVDEILNHPNIDAIVIASPSHLHLEQIAIASDAGKAIFCEKPIGLDETAIKQVLHTVEKNQSLLQLGFNRRFDPSFAHLQKRVEAGVVGVPSILKITSRDPQCPSKEYCANSGGIFMDMTIHDFDMARFLMQSEIVEVYATGSVMINLDLEELNDVDTAIVQLRFANGAMGVIDNSRQALYGYDQRIEVFGNAGMLIADNLPENQVKHYSRTATTQANPLYFFLERYQQAYLTELIAFHDAWLNNKPSPVSGHDGLKALQVAKAAKQSMDTYLPVVLD